VTAAPVFFERLALLSPAECESLLARLASRPLHRDPGHAATCGQQMCALPDREFAWLYARLGDAVGDVNARRFKFAPDLVWSTNVQYMHYGPDAGYDWHVDLPEPRLPGKQRKLAVSVGLSKPEDHDGGVLEIFPGGPAPIPLPLAPGEAVVFPAFVVHRVTPVTRGVRRVLVAWFAGAPFA
jgi:PKHD-type hydroxylase